MPLAEFWKRMPRREYLAFQREEEEEEEPLRPPPPGMRPPAGIPPGVALSETATPTGMQPGGTRAPAQVWAEKAVSQTPVQRALGFSPQAPGIEGILQRTGETAQLFVGAPLRATGAGVGAWTAPLRDQTLLEGAVAGAETAKQAQERLGEIAYTPFRLLQEHFVQPALGRLWGFVMGAGPGELGLLGTEEYAQRQQRAREWYDAAPPAFQIIGSLVLDPTVWTTGGVGQALRYTRMGSRLLAAEPTQAGAELATIVGIQAALYGISKLARSLVDRVLQRVAQARELSDEEFVRELARRQYAVDNELYGTTLSQGAYERAYVGAYHSFQDTHKGVRLQDAWASGEFQDSPAYQYFTEYLRQYAQRHASHLLKFLPPAPPQAPPQAPPAPTGPVEPLALPAVTQQPLPTTAEGLERWLAASLRDAFLEGVDPANLPREDTFLELGRTIAQQIDSERLIGLLGEQWRNLRTRLVPAEPEERFGAAPTVSPEESLEARGPVLRAHFTEADIEPMSAADARGHLAEEGEIYLWRDTGTILKGHPVPIEEAPGVVYHATVDLPAVQRDGALRAFGDGAGLTGDRTRPGVSLTTRLEEAKLIARELQRATTLAHGGDLATLLPRWAREDAALAGLPPDAFDRFVEQQIAEYQWRLTQPYPESAGLLSYATYRLSRAMTDPRNVAIQDPVMPSRASHYQNLSPEDIGVLAIPRENLYASGALVFAKEDALDEIRVYGDVPVRGARAVDLSAPLPGFEALAPPERVIPERPPQGLGEMEPYRPGPEAKPPPLPGYEGLTSLQGLGRVGEILLPDPRETHDVARTSVRIVPALHKAIPWREGTVNLDFGGGRFDEVTNYLRERGVENVVIDPYARSEAENAAAIARLMERPPDSVTVAHVLNVIEDDGLRADTIRRAGELAPAGTPIYFSVYEGDRSGVGKQTSVGTWQENRLLDSYLEEIRAVYPDARRAGNYIVATKSEPTMRVPLEARAWRGRIGEATASREPAPMSPETLRRLRESYHQGANLGTSAETGQTLRLFDRRGILTAMEAFDVVRRPYMRPVLGIMDALVARLNELRTNPAASPFGGIFLRVNIASYTGGINISEADEPGRVPGHILMSPWTPTIQRGLRRVRDVHLAGTTQTPEGRAEIGAVADDIADELAGLAIHEMAHDRVLGHGPSFKAECDRLVAEMGTTRIDTIVADIAQRLRGVLENEFHVQDWATEARRIETRGITDAIRRKRRKEAYGLPPSWPSEGGVAGGHERRGPLGAPGVGEELAGGRLEPGGAEAALRGGAPEPVGRAGPGGEAGFGGAGAPRGGTEPGVRGGETEAGAPAARVRGTAGAGYPAGGEPEVSEAGLAREERYGAPPEVPKYLHPDPARSAMVADALAWRYLTVKHGGMANKSALDDWLKARFGLSDAEARDISNYVEYHYPRAFTTGSRGTVWQPQNVKGMPEPRLEDYPEIWGPTQTVVVETDPPPSHRPEEYLDLVRRRLTARGLEVVELAGGDLLVKGPQQFVDAGMDATRGLRVQWKPQVERAYAPEVERPGMEIVQRQPRTPEVVEELRKQGFPDSLIAEMTEEVEGSPPLEISPERPPVVERTVLTPEERAELKKQGYSEEWLREHVEVSEQAPEPVGPTPIKAPKRLDRYGDEGRPVEVIDYVDGQPQPPRRGVVAETLRNHWGNIVYQVRFEGQSENTSTPVNTAHSTVRFLDKPPSAVRVPPRIPLPAEKYGPSPRIVEARAADPSKVYEFTPRVVDLNDPVASHSWQGTPNPEYPTELQPRDRSRQASEGQIAAIAADLDPERLLKDYGLLDYGTPIVGDHEGKLVVESGNARVAAIRKAAAQQPDNYARYKRELLRVVERDYPELLETARGMENPILVRERVSDVSPEEFARIANVPSAAPLSAAEQAMEDARVLREATIQKLEPERGLTLESALRQQTDVLREFVRTFPEEQRATLVDREGNPSRQALNRFQDALFAKTFPGEEGRRLMDLLETKFPDTVQTGVLNALPELAVAESLVREGARPRSLSIAPDLARVLDVLARLKTQGTKVSDYLNQPMLWGPELDPAQTALLEALDEVHRSSTTVRDFLRAYAKGVIDQPDIRQLEMLAPEKEPLDKAGLIEAAARELQQAGKAVGTLFDLAETVREAGLNDTLPDTPQPRSEMAPEEYAQLRGFVEGMEGYRVAQRAQRSYLGDLIIAGARLPRVTLERLEDPIGIALERIETRLETAGAEERSYLRKRQRELSALRPLSIEHEALVYELLERDRTEWTTSAEGPERVLWELLKDRGGFYDTPEGRLVLKNLGTELRPRIRVTIEPARMIPLRPYREIRPMAEEEVFPPPERPIGPEYQLPGLPPAEGVPPAFLPEVREIWQPPEALPGGGGGGEIPPVGRPTTFEEPGEPAEDWLRRVVGGAGAPPPPHRLGDIPPTLWNRIKKYWSDFVYEVWDDAIWARKLQQETGIPVYDLLTTTSGVNGWVAAQYEQFYTPIFKELGKAQDDFWEWVIAHHMTDVLKRYPTYKLPGGVKDPIRHIEDLRAEWGEEYTAFIDRLANRFWALNEPLWLNPAVEAGRITRKQMKDMLETFPHYIPFYREGFDLHEVSGQARTRAHVPAVFSRRMSPQGSERRIVDPAESYFLGFYRSAVRNWRNINALALIDALRAFDPTLLGEGKAPPGYENIDLWRNGVKESPWMPVELATLAKGGDRVSTNMLVKLLNAFGRFRRSMATEYSPAWAFVNPLVDAAELLWRENIAMLSPTYIRSVIDTVKKNPAWVRAAESGAFAGSLSRPDRPPDMPHGPSLRFESAGDAILFLPRLARHLAGATIGRAVETTEQAAKLAAFRKVEVAFERARQEAIANGLGDPALMDPYWARRMASQAARSTFNWAIGGNTIKPLGQALWPLNAAMQIPYQTYRAIAEKPTRLLVALAVSTIPVLLLHAWNRRFKSYETLPSYEYLNNFVLIVGEEEEEPDPRYPTEERRVHPIAAKIPKRGFLQLLSGISEIVLRSLDGADASYLEFALDGFLSAVDIVPDVGLDAFNPALAGTFIELAANHNLFTKQPIVPEYEMTRPEVERYGPETSALSVELGRALNISPRKVEFVLTDLLAGWGRPAHWVSDLVASGLGIDTTAPGEERRQPRATWEEISRAPIVSRFLTTRGTEPERFGYHELDRTVEESREAYYRNPEFRRLGLGVNPPGSTVTVNGVEVPLTPEQRIRILEVERPLVLDALNQLIETPQYQELHDTYRAKEIQRVRDDIREQVREYVIGQTEGTRFEVPEGLLAPGRVREAFEEYRTIPAYRATYWDPRTNAPVTVPLDSETYERIGGIRDQITRIRRIAELGGWDITTRQATYLYGLLTGDWRGAFFAGMMVIDENPLRQEAWEAEPELSRYYSKGAESPVETWVSQALTSVTP